MKKKQKILICIGVVAVVIVFLVVCIKIVSNVQNNSLKEVGGLSKLNVEAKNNYTIYNNIQGVEIQNVEIETKSEFESTLKAKVINQTENILEAHTIRIRVTNSDGLNESFGGNIPSIAPSKEAELTGIIRKDITSATNIEFELID